MNTIVVGRMSGRRNAVGGIFLVREVSVGEVSGRGSILWGTVLLGSVNQGTFRLGNFPDTMLSVKLSYSCFKEL